MRLRPAQLRPEGVVQLVLALRVAPRLLLLAGQHGTAPQAPSGHRSDRRVLHRLLCHDLARASQRLCCSVAVWQLTLGTSAAQPLDELQAHLLDIASVQIPDRTVLSGGRTPHDGVCQRLEASLSRNAGLGAPLRLVGQVEVL